MINKGGLTLFGLLLPFQILLPLLLNSTCHISYCWHLRQLRPRKYSHYGEWTRAPARVLRWSSRDAAELEPLDSLFLYRFPAVIFMPSCSLPCETLTLPLLSVPVMLCISSQVPLFIRSTANGACNVNLKGPWLTRQQSLFERRCHLCERDGRLVFLSRLHSSVWSCRAPCWNVTNVTENTFLPRLLSH